MADKKQIDEATGTHKVGHEWDGIEELDTPMPRWWLWTYYATIIWALGYVVMYPAWPMIEGATKGVLGWTSHGELQAQLDARDAQLEPVRMALVATDLRELEANPELLNAAIEGGRSAFKVHCVQCHGSGAAGGAGYPNLNDDDWLWGGDMASIEYTLQHGIRNPDHDDTRFSQMPAFGRDGLLSGDEIADVVDHVRVISGLDGPSEAAGRGAVVFADQCASCHGDLGKGDRTQGAPNLTDSIWMYGSSREELTHTIVNARNGVMPRWNQRLDAPTIRMLTAYVHSLGGGEPMPAPEPEMAAAPAPAAEPATISQ